MEGAATDLDDRPALDDAELPGAALDRLTARNWWWWLVGIGGIGLLIRIGSVLGRPHRVASGDAYYYFMGGRLLASGHWFINPFVYYGHQHAQLQTAEWPPLFVVVMAVPHLFGIHSYLAARLYLCGVGTGAIVMIAYCAREVAGRRVGLVAAALVAVFPNIWMSTDVGMSEVIQPILIGWVLLCVYRFWKRPSTRSILWVGVALGVSMLGRDEFSLLFILVVIPMCLLAKQFSWKRRAGFIGIALVVVVAILTPWVAYNFSRFEKPVFIRTGLGSTLASANCPDTYSGKLAGYWSFECALSSVRGHSTDESVEVATMQATALHFIHTHLGELPQVELDRLGRGFGFFRPAQQIFLDANAETRPYHWAFTGLLMYYALLVMAVPGTVALRRRRIPSFPLWASGVTYAIATLISYGDTRYRTTFDTCLCILSAVFLEWAARTRLGRQRALPDSDEPPAPPEPLEPSTAAMLSA